MALATTSRVTARRALAAAGAALLLSGCGGPYQISHSGGGAYEANLAALDDGFVVAWHDTRDGNPETYVRVLDARGGPQSPERRLTNSPDFAYEPDADSFAVGWDERSSTGSSEAKMGMWTREGEARWIQTLSAGGRNGRNPGVEANGGDLLCVWIEDYDGEGTSVWARWLDVAGWPLSLAQRLAPAGGTTWNFSATLDGEGQAWVVFDAKVGTRSEELFLVRLEDERIEVARLTVDDGFPSKYPDLVFGPDRVALTWLDERDGNREVYLFVAPREELQEGLE